MVAVGVPRGGLVHPWTCEPASRGLGRRVARKVAAEVAAEGARPEHAARRWRPGAAASQRSWWGGLASPSFPGAGAERTLKAAKNERSDTQHPRKHKSLRVNVAKAWISS